MRQVQAALVFQWECLKAFPSRASCGKSWLLLTGCRYSPGPAACTSSESVWGRISAVQGRNLVGYLLWGKVVGNHWSRHWSFWNSGDSRHPRASCPNTFVSSDHGPSHIATEATPHGHSGVSSVTTFAKSWNDAWLFMFVFCGELDIEMMLKHQGDMFWTFRSGVDVLDFWTDRN